MLCTRFRRQLAQHMSRLLNNATGPSRKEGLRHWSPGCLLYNAWIGSGTATSHFVPAETRRKVKHRKKTNAWHFYTLNIYCYEQRHPPRAISGVLARDGCLLCDENRSRALGNEICALLRGSVENRLDAIGMVINKRRGVTYNDWFAKQRCFSRSRPYDLGAVVW